MAEPIAKELREYVGNLVNRKVDDCDPAIIAQFLNAHADRIDAEHERRMADCRREVKRDVVRYVRGVLTDYNKGIKRVRKCDKAEVVRCRDCKHAVEHPIWHNTTICHIFTGHEVSADDYCSRGERREVADDGR